MPTVLFDAASQPRDSQIVVRRPSRDTTVLTFPGGVGGYWPWLFVAGGLALIAWEWQTVATLLRLDAKTWGDMKALRGVTLDLVAIAFGAILLLGRFCVTVTPQGIARGLRAFGMTLAAKQADFAAITKIACGQSGNAPVIWVHYGDGEQFVIEQFTSPEERDWVAGELTNAWSDATSPGAGQERSAGD